MNRVFANVIAGSILLIVDFVAREVFALPIFVESSVYIRLGVYAFILLLVNIFVYFISRGKSLRTKLRPVYRVIVLDLKKWKGIKDGTIVSRKKSEIVNIYSEIEQKLSEYKGIIMKDRHFSQDHLDAHEAIKEFTKFQGAAIQEALYEEAVKKLKNAFPKEKWDNINPPTSTST